MIKCNWCDRTFSEVRHRSNHHYKCLLNPDNTLKPFHLCDYRTCKNRLIKIRGRKCEVCELSEWMGFQIPIEIDHIDGNCNNNAELNLRLICPNCHAQTDNYKAKNIGKVFGKRKELYTKHPIDKYRKNK